MKNLTIVLGLYGEIEYSLSGLAEVIESVKKTGVDKIHLIISASGDKWKSIPLMQMIPFMLPNSRIIYSKDGVNQAELYNKTINYIDTEYVMFVDTNVTSVNQRINGTLTYLNYKMKDEVNILFWHNLSQDGDYISDMNRYGMLLNKDYYTINDIVVKTDYVRNNKFNQTELLCGAFFREWITFAAKNNKFHRIGDIKKQTICNTLEKNICRNTDIMQRYIIRMCSSEDRLNIGKINTGFGNDLSDDEFEEVSHMLGIVKRNETVHKKCYKIMILGGVWEYHHIQIVFLNYLEKLAGSGFATYNLRLDNECNTYELNGYDLVVFTRTRSDNSVLLAKYCRRKKIKTVYMLDDNWISIAKDFPSYGNIFVEGNPNFDNFIKIVKICDFVWYFNEYIREDLSKYTDRFIKSKISVNKNLFKCDNVIDKKGKTVVGYSGSLRYEDTAFKALARVARKRDDIIIALIGNLSNEQIDLFKGINIINIEFATYNIYAKKITEVQPDLLIAPLDSSRTSQSKCYNKYVESGVVGAATIFSRVKPYTDVIIDNENGFFIDDESEEGWVDKINQVLDNKVLLKKVKRNAQNDVISNYSVEAVLPLVKNNIERILKS